jgi:chaperonin GroEL
MKEKKARVEDALHATRAAVEEGIVAGGGVALIRATMSLDTLKAKCNEEEWEGVQIIKRAAEYPCRWIANNAGWEGAVVVNKVKTSKGNEGFNAQTCNFEDLMGSGIIDPTKVVRCALQNAASVAGLMITTEAMITEMPKEEKAMPQMPHGGMGDMY